MIDDEIFFIRRLLEIPTQGVDEPFARGVWMSQSEENFLHCQATFDEDQSGHGSFGWLDVSMPGYASEGDAKNQSLACDVVWQGGGNRPLVHPHECDHQLYHDHVQGVSWDRSIELARKAMHG